MNIEILSMRHMKLLTSKKSNTIMVCYNFIENTWKFAYVEKILASLIQGFYSLFLSALR